MVADSRVRLKQGYSHLNVQLMYTKGFMFAGDPARKELVLRLPKVEKQSVFNNSNCRMLLQPLKADQEHALRPGDSVVVPGRLPQ